jgi:hypothetical protein
MDNSIPPPPLPTEQPPQRHGCFTAWLVLMLIANTATAISTPLMLSTIRQAAPNVSAGSVAIIVTAAIANIVFAIALFKWRRWGFYGFIVTATVALITNLSIGLGIGQSIFGLIGIPLLYWVMNMGGANKAWQHLK